MRIDEITEGMIINKKRSKNWSSGANQHLAVGRIKRNEQIRSSQWRSRKIQENIDSQNQSKGSFSRRKWVTLKHNMYWKYSWVKDQSCRIRSNFKFTTVLSLNYTEAHKIIYHQHVSCFCFVVTPINILREQQNSHIQN